MSWTARHDETGTYSCQIQSICACKISLHTHFTYIEKSSRLNDCLKPVKEEKFTVDGIGSSTH